MLDRWAFVAGPLSSEDQSYGLSACDVPLAMRDEWLGLTCLSWDALLAMMSLCLRFGDILYCDFELHLLSVETHTGSPESGYNKNRYGMKGTLFVITH